MLDGFEIKNMYWTGAPAYGNAFGIAISTSTHVRVRNCYFHSWSHDMSNGILVSNDVTVSGCRIHDINKSFDPACHENGIESTGSGSQRIFNNLILKPEAAEAYGYKIQNEYRSTASSSPTVGAGINLGKETGFRFHDLDIGGKSRGEKWDIGAYQYGEEGGETKNPK